MNRIFVIFALLLAFVAQVHAQKEQSFMLTGTVFDEFNEPVPGANVYVCLLYTSDAADDQSSVYIGGRRIIKKIF